MQPSCLWAVEDADCFSAEGVRPYHPNECPGYDTKPFGGETPVLEFWGMWNTPSLPLLPGSL